MSRAESRADEANGRGHSTLAMPRAGVALVGVVAALAMITGWRVFYFLTDDAFIAFRYSAHLIDGHGLVWNLPPFAPVEGYTSLLWTLLLTGVWKITGMAPPDSANLLSLVFGAGTLGVLFGFLNRMRLPGVGGGARLAILGGIALGIVSNRTFLTWLSSGLETSLFNFCLTGWLYHALSPARSRSLASGLGLAGFATLAALTRPDGLLFAAGSVVILGLEGLGRRGTTRSASSQCFAAAPLVLVPIHLLWRYSYYGEWLPNTYYAKVVAAWPESGLRYAASFVIEYGLWVWAGLACAWIVSVLRSESRRGFSWTEHPGAWVAGGAIAIHILYYTGVVGGDHFEYRVYSPWIPLALVATPWLATRISPGPKLAIAVLVLFVAASVPIPWTHWAVTRGLETREETRELVSPVAPHLPVVLRPVVHSWDRWQAWLIHHHVGMRHQEHKVLYQTMIERCPSADALAAVPWRERPVAAVWIVGIVGWCMPEVAVIDLFGLNDRVIARSAVQRAPGEMRRMAHERRAPAGYVECFRPNVRVGDRFVVDAREAPLTDAEIVACEAWPRASMTTE